MRVAAIGDLHVQENDEAPYRELFSEISSHADVLLLCGDLTNFGRTREAEILAEDIKSCTVPVLTADSATTVESSCQLDPFHVRMPTVGVPPPFVKS